MVIFANCPAPAHLIIRGNPVLFFEFDLKQYGKGIKFKKIKISFEFLGLVEYSIFNF